MVLSSVQRMKLFIAFEAIYCILIADPFLLGTKGSLDYFLHLLVHQQIISLFDLKLPTILFSHHLQVFYSTLEIQLFLYYFCVKIIFHFRQRTKMGVHKYSHSFTRVQLQLIIDDYLGLAPYYKVLHKQMKQYIRKMQALESNIHNSQKVHPIKIFTKDYLSKNFQDCDTTEIHLAFQSPKCDIRTTYSSVVAKYYYIYPLEVIVEILESEDYYKQLPKNIIINHLLTTENLQIIIETLTIVSEEMSKKIKTTLSSKEVKKAQIFCRENIEQKKEEQDFFQVELPVIQEEPEMTLPQSKIDIPQQDLFEEEQEVQQVRKKQKKKTPNPFVRTQIASNMGQPQKRCTFCKNYLLYLSETYGEGYSDDCLNKLSKESIKYLKVIAQTVTHFTLFLKQNNLTQISNNIHTLNRVLNTIGIVITEDIFNSQLNPKNKKVQEMTYPKPRNLIEYLVPYFNSIEVKNKQRSKDVYAIDQLFRMVIYCPTVKEVTLQLQNYQVEQFQREDSVLKNVENQDKVRSLLRKQYNSIKQYQNERLIISKNTINNKPIYKQLQFEEQPPAAQNTQPQNYNVNSNANSSLPTSSRLKTALSSTKHPFIQKNQKLPLPTQTVPSFKKQNKSLLIQLTQSISHTVDDREIKRSKTDKNKFKKLQTDKKENFIDSISNNLKKNLMKNHQETGKSKINHHAQQTSLTLMKPPTLQKQVNNQLSQSDFRKIIYCTYAKNQGFAKFQGSTITTPISNQTGPNINNYLNSTITKSTIKKNNGYSSYLNQFIGRKQQQQHIECMQKLQKQTYNRQLLNGQFIRNQIYHEINLGVVKVYDNYANACGLIDTLRLQQFTTEDPSYRNQTSESTSSRRKLLRSYSKGKSTNVIQENSTKYNQTGLIRNQKYNKSIKSQLINHRQSYLRNVQNQNSSKIHLTQTSKLKKVGSKNQGARTIKDLYNQQLKRHLALKEKVQSQHSYDSDSQDK